MARKFSPGNAWKVARVLVNIFAGLAILFGVVQLSNYDKNQKYAAEKLDEECQNPQSDFQFDRCIYYLNIPGDLVSSAFTFIGSGIGLIVLFYGGTAIYRYVFPQNKKKEE